VNGVTTNYTLDLKAGLTQVLSDGTNTYLYGMDRIAQVNGSVTEYFLTDALGSVRQLADNTGAVTLAKSYQPYGTPLTATGSGASIYGFTSEQQDPTGLTYLRSRYYSSAQGRFLTRDTWNGSAYGPQSFNRWSYTENNPVNFIDPSGLWRWRLPGNIYHLFIEQYYEGVPTNPTKQLEFPIPGTPFRHPDMFNSVLGDVYEIEPWYLQSMGSIQVNGYVTDLQVASRIGSLSGSYFGNPYNWNLTPFHMGTSADWPGKLRIPLLPNFPWLDLVADYSGNGTIIYWIEPNALVVTLPFLVPNKRLVKPRDWNPGQYAPQPVYAISVLEGCGYGLMLVGGTIIFVTVAEDVVSLGVGTFDDAITIPAGILFINMGQRIGVLVPASVP
jgi:RHS repeat-associated protein